VVAAAQVRLVAMVLEQLAVLVVLEQVLILLDHLEFMRVAVVDREVQPAVKVELAEVEMVTAEVHQRNQQQRDQQTQAVEVVVVLVLLVLLEVQELSLLVWQVPLQVPQDHPQ
jgi:hypothetical protein